MNLQNNNRPKLSLLAMYDDMQRFMNSTIESQDQKPIIQLLEIIEESRIKWQQAQQDLIAKDSLIVQLQTKNHQMTMQIKSLQQRLAREVIYKEGLQKQCQNLKQKLKIIQDLIKEDEKDKSSKSKLSSVLNIFDDRDKKDPEESDDGLLFDKSEENIDVGVKKAKTDTVGSLQLARSISSTSSQPSDEPKNFNTIAELDEEELDYADNESEVLNTGFILDKKSNANLKEMQHSKKIADSVLNNIKQTPASSLNRLKSFQLASRNNMFRSNLRLEPNRLNSRRHTFQEKKAFQSLKCTVCNKNIGFCSSYFACIDCRGLTHYRCKESLPRPCIPHVANNAIKRMISSRRISNSRGFIVIGDFIKEDARPCVPALLVHCCNEVERRVNEAMSLPKEESSVIGLYRLCATDREVRELRNKILEAKSGIPNLVEIGDVQVICGVVKMFLRDLSDSLVTSILWNNFVRAADHVVKDDRIDSGLDNESLSISETGTGDSEAMQMLMAVILELPMANRDSLAFMMLHLMMVARAESVTKMTLTALSSIFGPTIVGNSEAGQLPTSRMLLENAKQVMVMKALFAVDQKFWSGILNDKNFDPFKEKISNPRSQVSSTNLKKLLETELRNQGPSTSNDWCKTIGNGGMMSGLECRQQGRKRSFRSSIDNALKVIY